MCSIINFYFEALAGIILKVRVSLKRLGTMKISMNLPIILPIKPESWLFRRSKASPIGI